jgi:hypothetical protein
VLITLTFAHFLLNTKERKEREKTKQTGKKPPNNQHFDLLIAVFMNGLDVQDESGFSGERFAAVRTHKVFGSPMDQPVVRHVLLCGKHSLAHITLNTPIMDLHVPFQPDKTQMTCVSHSLSFCSPQHQPSVIFHPNLCMTVQL